MFDAGAFSETTQGTAEVCRRRVMRGGGGEQNDVPALKGKPACAGRFAQDSFRSISKHSVSETLRCSKGDPTRIAFAHSITYNHSNQGMVIAPSLCVYTLEIRPGLNGLHAQARCKLDGKALAALGTTTSEHGAAALGGHTSTEAVGLGTLTLVRLVRTLHSYYPPACLNKQISRVSFKIVGKTAQECQQAGRTCPQVTTRRSNPAKNRAHFSVHFRTFHRVFNRLSMLVENFSIHFFSFQQLLKSC